MPEPLKLDYETLLGHLKTVVAEKPGFVYTSPTGTGSCYYASYDGNGAPTETTEDYEYRQNTPTGCGCGIGAALHAAGLPLEELVPIEGNPAVGLPFWADHRTSVLASEFQGAQDMGTPWGDALQRAIRASAHFESFSI